MVNIVNKSVSLNERYRELLSLNNKSVSEIREFIVCRYEPTEQRRIRKHTNIDTCVNHKSIC